MLPNLFQEEKGAIVEGKLKDKKFLIGNKILAKHDENYMPPEVADALKKSGNGIKNMISSFGYYSLLTATLLSLLEIISYIKNYNQKKLCSPSIHFL